MLFFTKLLILLFLVQKNLVANQNTYIYIFKNTLLKYNIMYDKLKDFKSGAICIPKDSNANLIKYAVGYSHNVYKKQASEQIALQGCEEMKKKLISYDCKCEIIL